MTDSDATVGGDLVISGDDLTMGTNTSGFVLVGDGTNYNPVDISGDIDLSSAGAATIQANSVALTTDTTGNYVATVKDAGSGHLLVTGSGIEGATVALTISADTLDFSEFSDSLTLDASTSITMDSNDQLLVTNGGTGDVIYNLTSTGDFLLQSSGNPGFTFSNDGSSTFAGGVTFSSDATFTDLIVSSGARVGTGSTPTSFTALADDSFFVEGAIEVDGTARFDSTMDINGVPSIGADITFDAATPTIVITNGETFAITDGTNTLLSLEDAGTTGNLTLSGTLDVNGDIIRSDSNLRLSATGYVWIGDDGTPDSASSDDDLYVYGGIEVDATTTLDGVLVASGDTTFNLAGVENIVITNTSASSELIDLTSSAAGNDAMEINFTLVNDGDVDALAALDIRVTSAATADADLLRGINIGPLTSADSSVTEVALRISSGWDRNIAYADISTVLSIFDTGVITWIEAGGDNTLMTLTDNGNVGDLALTGGLSVTGATTFGTIDLAPLTNVDAIDIDGTNMTSASFIDIDASNTSGTLVSVDYINAATLAAGNGGITGMHIDLAGVDSTTQDENVVGYLVTMGDGGGDDTEVGFKTLGTMDIGFQGLGSMAWGTDFVGATITEGELRMSNEQYLDGRVDNSIAFVENYLDITFKYADTADTVDIESASNITLQTSTAGTGITLDAAGGNAAGENIVILGQNLDLDASGTMTFTADDTPTTAIDVTSTGYTNALNVGANDIIGTTGNITYNGTTTWSSTNGIKIDGIGAVNINSGGAINIGDDAVTANISLGSSGARGMFIGNVNAGSSSTIYSGTGGGLTITGPNLDLDTSGTMTFTADDTPTTAIDVSSSGYTYAINMGANDATGTNWSIAGATGNITTAGDLAVNGGAITSSAGAVTLFETGAGTSLSIGGATPIMNFGNIGNAQTFNIAGVDSNSNDVVNIATKATGTDDINIGNSGAQTSITGDDWSITDAGVITVTAMTCADCFDFTEFADALSLDASTSIAMDSNDQFSVSNNGTGDIVFNLTSSGDFVVQDDTTPTFTAGGDGTITFDGATTFNTDVTYTLTGTENVVISNTSSTAEVFDLTARSADNDAVEINFTLGNDIGTDKISAIDVNVTSAATGDADTLIGINIAPLTSADGTVTENALVIGTGWDTGIIIAGAGDGTDALILTTGDILLSDGDLDISGGDFNVTLDAGDGASITSDATATAIGLTLTHAATAADADALNISLTQNDGAITGADLVGVDVLLTANDGDGDMFGLRIVGVVTDNAAGGVYTGIYIDNAENSGGSMDDAILIESSGTDNAIMDAIDVSYGNIYNALNVGGNNIIGTSAVINFADFDVDASGAIAVSPNVGLDTNAAGVLSLATTNATSITTGNALTTFSLAGTGLTAVNMATANSAAATLNFATSNQANVINIGTGSAIDDINIGGGGGAGADTINIGDASATVAIEGDTITFTPRDDDGSGDGGEGSFIKMNLSHTGSTAYAQDPQFLIEADNPSNNNFSGVFKIEHAPPSDRSGAFNFATQTIQFDGISTNDNTTHQAIVIDGNLADDGSDDNFYAYAARLNQGDTSDVAVTGYGAVGVMIINENNATADAGDNLAGFYYDNQDTDAVTVDAFKAASSGSTITDGLDVSDSDIGNAVNAGNNFYLYSTTRAWESSSGVITWEDTGGNDLMTLTDNTNVGDLVLTGDLLVADELEVNGDAYFDATVTVVASAAPTDDLFGVSNSGFPTTTADVNSASFKHSASNISTSAVYIDGAFASTTNALTYNILELDAMSPTNSTGTDAVNGVSIGVMTDPGGTIKSTAISIASGWDVDMALQNGEFITNTTNSKVKIGDNGGGSDIIFSLSGANPVMESTSGAFQIDGVLQVDLDAAGGTYAVCHDGVAAATNDVKLEDCTGAPAADYAEQYPVAAGVSFGDIVVPSNTVVVTQDGDEIVQMVKSSEPYAGPVVGIVSDNFGDFTSAGYNIDEDDNPMPVALVGRVPVKVTAEGGDISVGDYLTTSSTPGAAMRATKVGRVIGMALSDWDGVSETVMVQVNNSWSMGDVIGTDGVSTLVTDNVVISELNEATAQDTSFSSYGLALRGSAWDGDEAQAVEMMLQNVVEDEDNYRLSVRNTADSEVAYITNEGTMRIAGDMVIGGNLYPSDRGTPQTDKYIYYDGSDGAGGDFMRTNAKGWSTGSYDFAEMFPSLQELTAGELVAFSGSGQNVQRATGAEGEQLAGIVSTRPGFLAGENVEGAFPIALAGRVPTRVSTEGGAIAVGDPLTISSSQGIAMKAQEAGMIVGYALEAYSGGSDNLILTYVNLNYWVGETTSTMPGTDNRASGFASSGTSNFTSLNMSGNIYMGTNSITGIGRLEGLTDTWSIKQDGTITTRGLIVSLAENYQGEQVETVAVTSPEVMITLTGTAILEEGQAEVRFEQVAPEFNDIISTEVPIRVLVTPSGPVSLYVSEKDQNGFVVTRFAGEGDVEFDWMVTAYRRGYEPEEIEDVIEEDVIVEEVIIEPVVEEAVEEIEEEVVTEPVVEQAVEEVVEEVVEEAIEEIEVVEPVETDLTTLFIELTEEPEVVVEPAEPATPESPDEILIDETSEVDGDESVETPPNL